MTINSNNDEYFSYEHSSPEHLLSLSFIPDPQDLSNFTIIPGPALDLTIQVFRGLSQLKDEIVRYRFDDTMILNPEQVAQISKSVISLGQLLGNTKPPAQELTAYQRIETGLLPLSVLIATGCRPDGTLPVSSILKFALTDVVFGLKELLGEISLDSDQ